MEKFTDFRWRGRAVAHDQRRYRHDHSQAVPQNHQAHRARRQDCLQGAIAMTAAKTPISSSTSHTTARPRFSWPTTISAAARREHAPWALMGFGIRCVISAPRRHFYNNLLQERCAPRSRCRRRTWRSCSTMPSARQCDTLHRPGKAEIRGPDGGVVKFDIDAHRKHFACSTASTTSGSPWSKATRSPVREKSRKPRGPGWRDAA